MSVSGPRVDRGPGRARSDELLDLAHRITLSCPAAAVLLEAGGRVRALNDAAESLLELGGDLTGRSARALFGLGWRELEVIARGGDADLLIDLPGKPGRDGLRVRLEPVVSREEVHGAIAFLGAAEARTAVAPRPRADGFDALFGTDPALCAAKQAGERFAATPLPVLLLAKTGTGKELLARAIHASGPRRNQPFVAINCGALSPHLLESELFGYAPGAFTGANPRGHDGKIGAARGGTLFLDEVAEMPGPLQALLLRVLEDGTYYRVGDNVAQQADVRLVCATCRDLPRLVSDGSFRQDLYYRINGACLSLPTVRERADLAPLIRHLLADLAADSGQPAPPIDDRALDLMLGYDWPGNVRQLKTALRHALILGDGGPLRLEHLPGEVSGRLPGAPGAAAPPRPSPTAQASASAAAARETDAGPGDDVAATSPSAGDSESPWPARASTPRPRQTLAELEAERLSRAVEAQGGNLTRAAAELGIARTTLYRRLRKHGFLPERARA